MFDEASTLCIHIQKLLLWLAGVKQSDKAVTVDDITNLSVTLLQTTATLSLCLMDLFKI